MTWITTIEAHGKEYTVSETERYWILKQSAARLDIEYKVSKETCETVDALREYVLSEKVFHG